MCAKRTTETSPGMQMAFFPSSAAEAWHRPAKIAREMQAEIWEGGQQLTTAWFRRRQEAMETGIRAFSEMAACKDPAAMAAICDDWVTGSMRRIAADMNESRDLGARLAGIGQDTLLGLFRLGAFSSLEPKESSRTGQVLPRSTASEPSEGRTPEHAGLHG